MHEFVYFVVVVWLLLLAAALTLYAARTDQVASRAVALDALSIVFVALLTVLAIQRGRVGYLDVALVMGLLGFVQSVVTARLVEHKRELHE